MAMNRSLPITRLCTALALSLPAASLLISGCKPHPVPVVQMLAGQTMGTTYSIKIVPAADMPDLVEISGRVQAELKQVNLQMSTYIDSSELSKFNAQQTGDWFDVSPETAQVVHLAQEISVKTGGAFDVTVGPLVDLWGFGPRDRPPAMPDQTAIQSAVEKIGFAKLEVRLEPPALRKTQADLQVDLSAIAKGHGVDRVAAVLDTMGLQAYMVEIGGEVRTRGTRLDGKRWQLGIERPAEWERSAHEVIGLSDQALATSGDYRNFIELEGERFAHTIDPRTGWPAKDPIVSASAVADNCAEADAIATSMMSAGFEDGQRLAEENGWAVFLIAREKDDFRHAASSRFRQLFPETEPTVPTGVVR